MTDPITDMLNRIKNAQAADRQTVEILYSNIKNEIARILEKNKFIDKVEKKGRKTTKLLELTLSYKDGRGTITGMKRISKPGQKIYKDYRSLRRVKDGYGIAIISTSKGLLTDKEAHKEKVGGEVLCEIW